MKCFLLLTFYNFNREDEPCATKINTLYVNIQKKKIGNPDLYDIDHFGNFDYEAKEAKKFFTYIKVRD